MSLSCDVVIVGGGPAGSTAAALLAEKGRKVVVLERESFPRYQVGESLVPFCYFPLERLGLIERMHALGFQKKHAVQFVTPAGERSTPFYFSQHLDHAASMSWQVMRSEFDQMLLTNAQEKGAEVMLETQAIDFIRDNGKVSGVVAKSRTGDGSSFEIHAPLTIDASGRQALAITRNKWRQLDPGLDKTAIWTYFKGAARDTGLDEGSTTVAYLPEKAWFWYIPLPEDVVGAGVVADKDYLFDETNGLSEIFSREVGKNPWIEKRLAQGRQFGKYYVTREFSYRSEYCSEDGLVLVGDAFSFLDPVFSSGVYFALRSGEWAAESIELALEVNDHSAGRFQAYSERLLREMEVMRALVYAFYDPTFSFKAMIQKYPEVSSELTDCLIGCLDKDFSKLFAAIGEFVSLPGPLAYGKPHPVMEKGVVE